MAGAEGAAGDVMEIQMGPSHPASHGTIKFNLRLDGEPIVEVEAMTGARLTVTYCRLGGVMKDLPADMKERTAAALKQVRRILTDCDRLLSRNRIFFDRMVGIGTLSRADAISYGLTGPLLRATGVPYDVRKA